MILLLVRRSEESSFHNLFNIKKTVQKIFLKKIENLKYYLIFFFDTFS